MLPTAIEILNDPSAHNWLKDQIRLLLQRDIDPVDLANDCAFLADWIDNYWLNCKE